MTATDSDGPVVVHLRAPIVTSIAVGWRHTCAVRSEGAPWCWGGNDRGQLGDGTTSDRLRPVRVTKADGSSLTGVTAISVGVDHSCAVTSLGNAWCWGDNSEGELGDGGTTERHRAVRVTRAGGRSLTRVTAIYAVGHHTCAVTSVGAAWCWGSNTFGWLGDGTTIERHRAVRVTTIGGGLLTGVTAISAIDDSGRAEYFRACARTSDGAAWCWGYNTEGELGDGTTTERHGAVRVTRAGGKNLTGVTSISIAGRSSCARTSDSSAWCWGLGGALGDGTATQHNRAVHVTKAGGGNLTGVKGITNASCAYTGDGAAWCWGSNFEGRLGDGTTNDRHRAVRVTTAGGRNLSRVTGITVGAHTCARTSDGAAWCWGRNFFGQLGDGTTVERHRAVSVTTEGRRILAGVGAIAATDHTCVITNRGGIKCWGLNDRGQLGNGTKQDSSVAVDVLGLDG